MRTLALAVASLTAVAALVACSSSSAPRAEYGTEKDKSATEPGTDDTSDDKNVFESPDGSVSACGGSDSRFDEPGNKCDDDQDGKADNVGSCDSSLAWDANATSFAKAIGICKAFGGKTKGKWGLVSAEYTNGFKSTAAPGAGQHGILGKFGSVLKPQEGKNLGVLSSGWAQEYNGAPGAAFTSSKNWTFGGDVPAGFPKSSGSCSVSKNVNDVVAVKLKIKAPENAKGFAFDFNFFSSEWPNFICSNYNDSFIAVLTAPSFNNGVADNISFDAKNNPVSVNSGFFDRCTPGTRTSDGKTSVCAGGPSELDGTGYEAGGFSGSTQGGATGWLTTQSPIEPGEEFELDFMIWDTGDSSLDSSVLIDNFHWIAGETKLGTDRVN